MEMNRREFLWKAGALAIGAGFLAHCSPAAQLPEPGLQLYTVRDLLEKDLKGTLQKIADIGYKNLEAAAGAKGHYYGMKPADFSKFVADMGMKLRSSHVLVGAKGPQMPFETLHADMPKLVDMAAGAGQEYLTCAYLFPEERQGIDDYKRYTDLFNKTGEACRKAGLQFAYHNHDFEFETLDGQVPYELLLSQVSPDHMKMELDLYWVSKIGKDPLQLFEQHPGRFVMWHVKDMDKTEKKFFTEVGNGSIDFIRIFAEAKKAGLSYYFVEQDQTPGNPIDSITTSFGNLKKIVS
ncbi:MAG: sugar phosphate isomerase/epimerase family protein [Adhaeribacter sp.]